MVDGTHFHEQSKIATAVGKFLRVLVADLQQRLFCLWVTPAQFNPVGEGERIAHASLGRIGQRVIVIPNQPLQRLFVAALGHQVLRFLQNFLQINLPARHRRWRPRFGGSGRSIRYPTGFAFFQRFGLGAKIEAGKRHCRRHT